MGKLWTINGPEGDRYTLAETAVLLGYEDVQTIRRLVAEGRLPTPRGHGTAQYYTGLDLAVIYEFFGRWAPAPAPAAKTLETAQKRSKTGEDAQE